MITQNKLIFKSFNSDWKNGLPIGNGRLAGMIHGKNDSVITLNHEHLYRGVYLDRDVETVSESDFKKLRELLLNEQYEEGTVMANSLFAKTGGTSKIPGRVDDFQVAGALHIEDNSLFHTDVNRELNLEKALVTTKYSNGKNRIRKEFFANCTDEKIICVRLTSTKKMKWKIYLDRVRDKGCQVCCNVEKRSASLNGEFDGDSRFKITARIMRTDGEILEKKDSLIISGCTSAEIYVNIGISKKNESPDKECKQLPAQSFDKLLKKHIEKHRNIYNKCKLELSLPESNLPLEKRIGEYKKGAADPALVLLMFNYGRYLLISSSGELPANLQGKWCNVINPPWASDFHLDINLQMNYWCSEPCSLEDSAVSLFNFAENLVPHAKEAAKKLYGAKGIVFPIQTDANYRSTLESKGWAVWIGAAPWLAQHFWLHFEYNNDIRFLKERAYPFFKLVAEFYEDYLVKDKNNIYQIVPSQSPENRFKGCEIEPVSICYSSTMDLILCKMVLEYAINSAKLLNVDSDQISLWQELIDNLQPLQIDKSGRLQEWVKDFQEVEPGHRHFSHLIGVFPGDMINEEDTPELYEACKKSLYSRLSHGGGHTGWSRAWTACMFSRFGEGDKSFENLEFLIKSFATKSLLDLVGPKVFQIDGNLGFSAGVSEMLLQSYKSRLNFLPALPNAWNKGGKINSLRARGGFNVSMEWADKKLTKAVIISNNGNNCSIIKKADEKYNITCNSQNIIYNDEGTTISFATEKGAEYVVTVIYKQ